MNAEQKFKKLILINLGAILVTIIAMSFDMPDVKDFLWAYMDFVGIEVAYIIGKNTSKGGKNDKLDKK